MSTCTLHIAHYCESLAHCQVPKSNTLFVNKHTQRAGTSVGHAGDPGEEHVREERHQISRGAVLCDKPFAKASAQDSADLQRVAEDEVVPLHPVLGAPNPGNPPALVPVVVFLRPPRLMPTAHGRRHLRPAPPVPARRRVLHVHLPGLQLARLGHGHRHVQEVVQLPKALEPIRRLHPIQVD